jgi:hypothetical protein
MLKQFLEHKPEAYDCLRRNVARNGLEQRITTIRACIGASSGEMELAVVAGMPESSP